MFRVKKHTPQLVIMYFTDYTKCQELFKGNFLKRTVRLNMHDIIEQILTVCAYLTNVQMPAIHKWLYIFNSKI